MHFGGPGADAKTLVLLTRHYAHLPPFFRMQGRSSWQPSRPIPVSTWDCTSKTTVEAAFDLGRDAARAALKGLRLTRQVNGKGRPELFLLTLG